MLGWDAYSLDLYFAETETVQAVVTMDRLGSGEPVDVPHAYASGPPGPMTRKVLAAGGAADPAGRQPTQPTRG